MNELPRINPGDDLSATTARQWRYVMDKIGSLDRAVFGDNNTQRSLSGVRSTARTLPPVLREPDKTVVIVRKPLAGDLSLLCREAKYVNLPPKPCTGDGESATCFYEWFGTDFEVYPPMGKKCIDFEGDENTAAATIPPKFTTKFHRCHREHDSWVLDTTGGESGGIEHCVVREVFAPPSIIVQVQLITIGTEPPSSGQWVISGGVIEAHAKPGRLSHHYAAWVWQGPIHQTQTRYLPLYMTSPKPRLGFELDMAPQFLPASARVTDCRPFTRATGV